MKEVSKTDIVEIKTALVFSKTKSYFEFLRIYEDGKSKMSIYNSFETFDKNKDKVKELYPNVRHTHENREVK